MGNKTEEWFWREAAPCMNPLILDDCDWGPALKRRAWALPTTPCLPIALRTYCRPSVRNNVSRNAAGMLSVVITCGTQGL